MADNDKKLCIKRKKKKKLSEFYCKKNGEPVELCKDCLTLHIDNFDESENFEVLFFGLSNLTLNIGGNNFLFNINN